MRSYGERRCVSHRHAGARRHGPAEQRLFHRSAESHAAQRAHREAGPRCQGESDRGSHRDGRGAGRFRAARHGSALLGERRAGKNACAGRDQGQIGRGIGYALPGRLQAGPRRHHLDVRIGARRAGHQPQRYLLRRSAAVRTPVHAIAADGRRRRRRATAARGRAPERDHRRHLEPAQESAEECRRRTGERPAALGHSIQAARSGEVAG